jgi:hypothetical protein
LKAEVVPGLEPKQRHQDHGSYKRNPRADGFVELGAFRRLPTPVPCS